VVQRWRAVGHGLRAALAPIRRDAYRHPTTDGVRRSRAGRLEHGRRYRDIERLEEDVICGRKTATVVAVHRGR